MGWLNKNPDPVSDRARALNSQIAALEQQIKKLGGQAGHASPQPRLRSTARPHAATVTYSTSPAAPAAAPETIFEEVDQDRLKDKTEVVAPPEHFNELGVRKYNLAGQLQRFTSHFRGPSASNPRLVNYLAAGGVQGLRPMRYEKRVARNRLLLLVVGLFLLLLGILSVFVKNH